METVALTRRGLDLFWLLLVSCREVEETLQTVEEGAAAARVEGTRRIRDLESQLAERERVAAAAQERARQLAAQCDSAAATHARDKEQLAAVHASLTAAHTSARDAAQAAEAREAELRGALESLRGELSGVKQQASSLRDQLSDAQV